MIEALIIGAGAAGMSAALQLAEHMHVTLLLKGAPHQGATQWAQGGIAGLLSEEDSAEQFIDDILQAGANQGSKAVIASMVMHSKAMLDWVHAQGVRFSEVDGAWHLNREGGHQCRRIVHVNDATGKMMSQTLWANVLAHPNITCHTHTIAIDLMMEDGVCIGVYAWDKKQECVRSFMAGQVVLATGGASHVYAHTTHADHATGDGIAMAKRAGCSLRGMAYNQFHPTCLAHKTPLLLTEALRGEGAKLRNHEGEAFMINYHPSAELAPRDIVARSIAMEMMRSKQAHVWLDITHVDSLAIQRMFPTLCERLGALGYDLTGEMIPVLPAAHYTCGGIETEIDGRTAIKGLYAIGEVASTGLHGANRLASTSLLECLVMGHGVAKTILSSPLSTVDMPIQVDRPRMPKQCVAHIIDESRTLMSQHFGIIRRREDCERVLARLFDLSVVLEDIYHQTELHEALIEARHLLTVSIAMLESGLSQSTSIGLHYWETS